MLGPVSEPREAQAPHRLGWVALASAKLIHHEVEALSALWWHPVAVRRVPRDGTKAQRPGRTMR